MSEWQPIETAPSSRLLLGWFDGTEGHSGASWKRYGVGLLVMHDDVPSKYHLDAAYDRIMGPESPSIEFRYLRPTHWMPLPEPPK